MMVSASRHSDYITSEAYLAMEEAAEEKHDILTA
jgi:hypothetical protein